MIGGGSRLFRLADTAGAVLRDGDTTILRAVRFDGTAVRVGSSLFAWAILEAFTSLSCWITRIRRI